MFSKSRVITRMILRKISQRDGATSQERGRGWFISREQSGRYKWYQRWLAISTSVYKSRAKHAWARVVKRWLTYRKMIRDTMQVRRKYGEKSCGDCRVSKNEFGP
ncbi:hypothetical protein YC2023_032057 [Brassica napus]